MENISGFLFKKLRYFLNIEHENAVLRVPIADMSQWGSILFYNLANHGSSLKWWVIKVNEINQLLRQTTRWNFVHDYFQRLIISPGGRLESQKEFGHLIYHELSSCLRNYSDFFSPQDKPNGKTSEETKIETGFTFSLHKRIYFISLLLNHLPLKNVKAPKYCNWGHHEIIPNILWVVFFFEAHPTIDIIHHLHC